MSAKSARCPNCGATLAIASPGTVLVVCESCNCSSYRTDVDLELIGRVSERAPLVSSFRIGTSGRYEGKPFVVRGQLQLDHGLGPWNEWCAETADGGWLWIAEAQGETWVLEEGEPPAGADLSRDETKPLSRARLDAGGAFTCHEIGEGRVVTVAGELPVRIETGVTTSYADLGRGAEEVATLDWTRDGAVECFVGRRVRIEELELDRDTQPAVTPREVRAKRITCENCGAPIEIRDPAGTKHVACASCAMIVRPDHHGQKAVQAQKKIETTLRIALGSRGTLAGEDVLVLGCIERFVKHAGRRYAWREHLLRTDAGAYRWLIENEGHWAYGAPVAPAEVFERLAVRTFRGQSFKHFTEGEPEVAWVLGELFWDVQAGDKVRADDYVAPGAMLSVERTRNEIATVWSRHVGRAEVARAFGVKYLPAPRGVGMAQPNPFRPRAAWLIALAAIGALFLLRLGFGVHHAYELVFAAELGPVGAAETERNVEFTEPFEVHPEDGNLRISMRVPGLDQGWIGLGGALVEERTGAVTTFGIEAQRYSGVADGERWSEGDGEGTAWIGSVERGTYRLRLDPLGQQDGLNKRYSLEVHSQVPRWLYFFLALLALLVVPALSSIGWLMFEHRRWAQSDHPWGE